MKQHGDKATHRETFFGSKDRREKIAVYLRYGSLSVYLLSFLLLYIVSVTAKGKGKQFHSLFTEDYGKKVTADGAEKDYPVFCRSMKPGTDRPERIRDGLRRSGFSLTEGEGYIAVSVSSGGDDCVVFSVDQEDSRGVSFALSFLGHAHKMKVLAKEMLFVFASGDGLRAFLSDTEKKELGYFPPHYVVHLGTHDGAGRQILVDTADWRGNSIDSDILAVLRALSLSRGIEMQPRRNVFSQFLHLCFPCPEKKRAENTFSFWISFCFNKKKERLYVFFSLFEELVLNFNNKENVLDSGRTCYVVGRNGEAIFYSKMVLVFSCFSLGFFLLSTAVFAEEGGHFEVLGRAELERQFEGYLYRWVFQLGVFVFVLFCSRTVAVPVSFLHGQLPKQRRTYTAQEVFFAGLLVVSFSFISPGQSFLLGGILFPLFFLGERGTAQQLFVLAASQTRGGIDRLLFVTLFAL
ncbi:MAG: uncharacterized protein A8A55_1139 [Amphiamblys sp. WSBS2006]|nr:MAG: uncharacterized protein A8A55_1139 [Amphiamblys sp. WSBS2006]